MKKTLLSFSLIIFSTLLSASIVYTSASITVGPSNTQVSIDLDNNAVSDITIEYNGSGFYLDGPFSSTGDCINPPNDCYVVKYNAGGKENNGDPKVNGSMYPVLLDTAGGNQINFPIATKYMIINFTGSSGGHEGWIEFNIPNASTLIITGYAFEDQTGTQIIAGDDGTAGPTGIGAIEEASFSIWPNPAVSNIQLNYGGQANEIDLVKIYSVDGSLIQTFNDKPTTIDLSSFEKGLYIVAIQFNDQAIETKRITIQ